MKVVYIAGRRDGYAPEQVYDHTYTVRQLINELESYPDNAPVLLNNDSGYTFGIIDYDSITLDEFEEEDED